VTRRMLFAIVGWLAAALVATIIGVRAVSLLNEGITDSMARPLTSAEAQRALDRSTQAPAETSEDPDPATPSLPAGPTQLFKTAGGTVVARCAGNQVILSSWSPAQGFRGENGKRGPAPSVSLKFESDEAEISVTVECTSGTPQVHTQSDNPGHQDGQN
jgi:hypothetical protein